MAAAGLPAPEPPRGGQGGGGRVRRSGGRPTAWASWSSRAAASPSRRPPPTPRCSCASSTTCASRCCRTAPRSAPASPPRSRGCAAPRRRAGSSCWSPTAPTTPARSTPPPPPTWRRPWRCASTRSSWAGAAACRCPVQVRDPFTGAVVTETVMADVKIDDDLLKRIAERTGGEFFRATDPASLRQIFDRVDQLEKSEIKIATYRRYRELFPSVLAARGGAPRRGGAPVGGRPARGAGERVIFASPAWLVALLALPLLAGLEVWLAAPRPRAALAPRVAAALGPRRPPPGRALAVAPARAPAARDGRPRAWRWRGRSGASCARRSSARASTSCWCSTPRARWPPPTWRRAASSWPARPCCSSSPASRATASRSSPSRARPTRSSR